MRCSVHLGIGLLLSLATTSTLGRILNEEFNESLVLRPLPDGRLLSAFSFRTLLRGAVPRDPETLGSEDESEFLVFTSPVQPLMCNVSAALYFSTAGSWTGSPRICRYRTPYDSECWKVGLRPMGATGRGWSCYGSRAVGVYGREFRC